MPIALADLAAAREQFLGLVAEIRPDLHRYTTRLVGSAIDGEDIVQDALAKAFYAVTQMPELPALRPWLFTIARNTALDFLRRYDRRHGESLDDPAHANMPAADDEDRDPFAMRAALAAFATLPVAQRSAVILKDVLGESVEDIAAHLGTTVQAVKALLVRGRTALAHASPPAPPPKAAPASALVDSYVALFNARDWTGLQAMLREEVELDLVAKSQRRGKAVGGYYGQYAKEIGIELRAGTCDGREAIGAYRDGALSHIIFLEWDGAKIERIRDFKYVPYLAESVVFTPR